MMFARFRRTPADVKMNAVARVAADVLKDNSMVQLRTEDIGGDDGIRSLIVSVSKLYGHNVRASTMQGLVTLYGDDIEFSAKDVVVLRVGTNRGIPR